nr:MAG TPA: Minor capsid protein [Caudoviricetes sp.]
MIDKRMLPDSVKIQKPTGKDDWGKETYSEPLLLSPCKFDRVLSHTGSGSNRSETKPSTVIVYPQFCPVELDKSYLGGVVDDDGTIYLVRSIIPQYHPLTRKLLAYEIEVI